MAGDNHLGPQLSGVFDFTILFEQSVLSLAPAAIFILLTTLRLFLNFGHERRVGPGPLLWSKLVVVTVFGCLQVTLLTIWCLDSTQRIKISIAETAVAILEAFALGLLSYTQHLNSNKPSILLNCYLLLTIILDIALVRTFWIRQQMNIIASLFTASLACKAVLFVLEETPKTPIIRGKGPNRETSAGVISRGLFWWLNRLFYTGSRNIIDADDLPNIHKKFDSEKLLNTLESCWQKAPKDSPLALLKCTFGAYKWQFFAGVIPRLLFSGFSFAQPFLIRSVIIFVGSPDTRWSLQISSGLIGATVLVYIGLAVTAAWHKHMSYQLVTMYRGGLVSMIYKKTLGLKTVSVKDNAPVTLMSTDMDNIIAAGESLHDMWASFLDLPIGIYLLYRQVGPPSLFVLIPTVVTTVLSGVVAPAMEPATVAWNQAVQARVGETSHILGQIKGIKMMGLTDYFHSLVQSLRVEELRVSDRFRWLLVTLSTLAKVSSDSTPIIIILSAIYWPKAGGGLSVTEAFTSLSIISLVTAPLVMILTSMMSIAGVFGAFMRIQTFLLQNEQKDTRLKASAGAKRHTSSKSEYGNAKTDNDKKVAKLENEMDLSDLSPLSLDSGKLGPAVIITEASFKSDDNVELLQGITMTIQYGTLNMVSGRVGCGKSSLLKAIIGELSPEKGSVSTATGHLAYCDQTPWLQNTTIKQNILGQSPLNENWLSIVVRACALDEDISNLPKGEQTTVGSGGAALSGGQKQRLAFARAIYSQKSIIVIDDAFTGLDNKTARSVFQRLMGPDGLLRKSKVTVIMSTSNIHFLAAADYITLLDEGRIIRNQVSYDSIPPAEWGALESDSSSSDYEDEKLQDAKQEIQVPDVEQSLPMEVDLTRQTGDLDCYKIYLNSLGKAFLSIVFSLAICHAGMVVMPQIWLRLWVEKGDSSKDPAYTAGYVGFGLASILSGTLSMGIFLLIGIPRSAAHLHEGLLASVCRAPLYFFTTTESGTILNRFSQDMKLVDSHLPLAFYMTIELTLRGLAQAGVIASGATFVSAFIPLVFLALYVVQKYYLRTSRQMRILDLEMKSPLYTHFTETLAGLSTVRAFGWSEAFMDENIHRLNMSQKPFYLMFCIQRWLQVVLALFVAGLALVLVTLALRISNSTSQGAIGLSMVNLLGFNQTLALVIDQWTVLETSLGAISRLKAFINETPNENKEAEREIPLRDWPAQGTIELVNVTASYSDTMVPVLQDVSLKIQPGQKVCICGRSGSGKSSLVLTLLRLLELHSGTIRIDDVDLSTVPRQHIRSRLTTIPQDPVKMNGTVRLNLDPENQVQSDAMLIEVLRKTGIWPPIESRGGLDADSSELGFSVGQQQLFCLARALLSRSKVVLLDEATSSVDRVTDEKIRRIVREEMDGKTIVEVAHRLEIVRDFDVVVVMGQGKVVETGSPAELLSRPSELRRLWENHGL